MTAAKLLFWHGKRNMESINNKTKRTQVQVGRQKEASQIKRLLGDNCGNIKTLLNPIEGMSFRDDLLLFFIMLSYYKFAARLLSADGRVLDAGCGHGMQ